MTISSFTPPALLDRIHSGNPAQVEVGVALLKKSQEQMKQEAEALLAVVEAAGAACTHCHKLDAYA